MNYIYIDELGNELHYSISPEWKEKMFPDTEDTDEIFETALENPEDSSLMIISPNNSMSADMLRLHIGQLMEFRHDVGALDIEIEIPVCDLNSETPFTVYVNGEIYSSEISAGEVETIIAAYRAGYRAASIKMLEGVAVKV